METKQQQTKKALPIEKFRAGSVELAVWENATKNGTMRKYEITASYKGADGKMRSTHSLSYQELLTAVKLAEHVWSLERIHQLEEKHQRETSQEAGN